MARKKKSDIIEGENEMTETVENEVKTEKTKRDIVIETIEAGGATMESLIEAADCKYASIMSIFSMLRLMGQCPVKDVPVTVTDDEGNDTEVMTYRLVSVEEWEAIKAEKSANAKTKRQPKRSPEEQLEALNARIEKLSTAKDAAQLKADDFPSSEVLQLKAEKAAIELRIVEIEKAELESKING